MSLRLPWGGKHSNVARGRLDAFVAGRSAATDGRRVRTARGADRRVQG